MRTSIATILVAMHLALLSLAVPGAAVAQGDGECLSGREIQQAIANGEIRSLDDVLASAGISGQPLSVQVCNVGGSLQYVVNLMDEAGESESIVLNAQGG